MRFIYSKFCFRNQEQDLAVGHFGPTQNRAHLVDNVTRNAIIRRFRWKSIELFIPSTGNPCNFFTHTYGNASNFLFHLWMLRLSTNMCAKMCWTKIVHRICSSWFLEQTAAHCVLLTNVILWGFSFVEKLCCSLN